VKRVSWSTTLKNRQQIRAYVQAGEEIAVMFSDIRGFTSYTAREGDRAAYKLSRIHEVLLKEQIEAQDGIVVKTMGDGIMAAFAELSSAVHSAVGIQKAIRQRNRQHPAEPIDVGIGLASGTPIVTEADLIGNSVNLSQRVSSLAKGGQILATEEFTHEILPSQGYRCIPLGKRQLKGLGAVRLYEIAWMAEVARLTDRNDKFTLVLTERGTLVTELAKGVRTRIGNTATMPDKSPFSSILQRGMSRLTQAIVDKSLSAIGIAREQPIDRVDLSIGGGKVIVRVGKKEITLHDVDMAQAASFSDKLVQMRRELYPEQAEEQTKTG